ncbi:MAG TPA: 30S ribosomal protein S8, partial [Acidimicrobiales bacterium]
GGTSGCRRPCGQRRRPARRPGGRRLRIQLKYTPERQRTISGLRRVSKPGLRVYTRADKVPRVLGGMGIAILSTNQGLMTDREARERHVGGEVLCQVW